MNIGIYYAKKMILPPHQVADPYRWFEDLWSEETISYINAENRVSYLFSLNCRKRDKIMDQRFTLDSHYKRVNDTLPVRHGKYFITQRSESYRYN